MTWKIEEVLAGDTITFRLSGRIGAEHLEKLKAVLGRDKANIALDLKEVTIVGVDAVRFLGKLERAGVPLLHCAPYIREWIRKECDNC